MFKHKRISKISINIAYFSLLTAITLTDNIYAEAYTDVNVLSLSIPKVLDEQVEDIIIQDYDNEEDEYDITLHERYLIKKKIEKIEDYYDAEANPETLNKDLLYYSGMALDHELEDYIREKCYEVVELGYYDIEITGEDLFRIIMTLGEKESNGTWECNGVISKTNDYGQFQINKCNHKTIQDNLGYSTEELLNDRYKNTDAAIYLICNNILSHSKCKKSEDVFGMYNGWTNWKNIKRSVNYAENCLKIMDNYFETTEFEYQKVKELER